MAKSRTEKNKELVMAGDTEESSTEPVVKTRKDFTKPDPKSGKLRPYGGTGEGNRKHDNVPPEARCTAKRAKDGERCTKLKIRGAEVCGTHGGRAPQVLRNAMARIANSSDKLVQAEIAIALDEEQPATVRLAAMRDLLDRAGAKSSDKVELEHSMKPYEQTLVKILRKPDNETLEGFEQRAIDMDDDRY